MAAPSPDRRHPVEIIDLISDDDDMPEAPPTHSDQLWHGVGSDAESARFRSPPREMSTTPVDDVLKEANDKPYRHGRRGSILIIDGEEVFIPDEEPVEAPVSPSPPPPPSEVDTTRDQDIAVALNDEFTVDDCLQRVLEIFPDISREYVHKIYKEFDREGDYETLPGPARLDNIIEQLVSSTSYPKEEKGTISRCLL